MSKSSVFADMANQGVTDITLRQDVTTLALRQAIGDNHLAYNLPNSFIDQFEDSSGIGTFTTAERNTAGEHLTAALGGAATITHNTASSNAYLSTHTNTYKKFGTTSMLIGGTVSGGSKSAWIDVDMGTNFVPGTGNYTVEYFIRYPPNSDVAWLCSWRLSDAILESGLPSAAGDTVDIIRNGTDGQHYYRSLGPEITDHAGGTQFAAYTDDIWYHVAIVRDGVNHTYYLNGTQAHNNASGSGDRGTMPYIRFSVEAVMYYFDCFRISNSARYAHGSSFSIPTARFTADSATKFLLQSNDTDGSTTFEDTHASEQATQTFSAVGNIISETTTVSGNKTKVSGVMLWKDGGSGTSTLGNGNDLEILFTCNGGTNWTTVASYTAVTPLFSTGIKMVKLGETTCTAGTDIRYKAVWATQSSGVIETQLHGIGLNY
jgi:hypothetical protein